MTLVTPALRDALAAWNAANTRARREHEAHPSSAWTYAGGCLCHSCRHARTYIREYRRKTRRNAR